VLQSSRGWIDQGAPSAPYHNIAVHTAHQEIFYMVKTIRLFNCEVESATVERALSDEGGGGEA
jgi:hypothetical protein